MKKCFKCDQLKPLSDFYKHSQMADGRLNKCVECTKSDARATRKRRIDYYRAYDRIRGNRQSPEYVKEYRRTFPNKYKAHAAVNRAIRAGKLIRDKCEQCNDSHSFAHHDDYLKPLDVRWLCPSCHKAWHHENGEGANARTTQ